MDRNQLSLFAKRLVQENVNDVCAALKALEEMPRKEGESALPDIGTILEVVDAQKRARQARESNAAEERFLLWQCPICGVRMSGFVRPGASRLRYCHGIPRKHTYRPGEVCGGVLNVIADIPAKAANEAAFHG